jgi:hypothetical protein
MDINANDIGKLVELPLKPEWGPGKIHKIEKGYAYIYFKNSEDHQLKQYSMSANPLLLAPNQADMILDNLQLAPEKAKKTKGKKAPVVTRNFDQALEYFGSQYPQKFEDMGYLGGFDEKNVPFGERRYKERAAALVKTLFADGQLRRLVDNKQTQELKDKTNEILQKQHNLLFRTELISLNEFLGKSEPEQLLAYFDALAKVLDDPEVSQGNMQPYFEAVNHCPTPGFAKWPNATLLPFLARSDKHFFLKPNLAKQTAVMMNMELNYEVKPNWKTYSSLLGVAQAAFERLKPLGARDLMDVQSFFWVVNR